MTNALSRLVLGACIMVSMSAPMLAAPEEPLRLKPASKWISEYQPDGCRLMREFGEGDTRAIFVMNRFAPHDDFQLTLAGKPFRRNSKSKVTLQFGANEGEQQIDFLEGNFASMPALLMSGTMQIRPMTEQEAKAHKKSDASIYVPQAPLGAEREKAVTFVKLGKPFRKPIVLELGEMDKPFAALSICVDDLVQSWGLDPAVQKSLTRRPAPANYPGSWVTTSDYPENMLAEGQRAIVNFRLTVDATGAVTACFIQQTTRPKEFDAAVCKSISRRAKFDPALDKDGAPVPSYYTNTVTFVL